MDWPGKDLALEWSIFFGEVGRLYFLFFPFHLLLFLSAVLHLSLFFDVICTGRHIVSNALPVFNCHTRIICEEKDQNFAQSDRDFYFFFPSDLTDAHCPRRLILLSTPSKFLQSEAFLFFPFSFSFPFYPSFAFSLDFSQNSHTGSVLIAIRDNLPIVLVYLPHASLQSLRPPPLS